MSLKSIPCSESISNTEEYIKNVKCIKPYSMSNLKKFNIFCKKFQSLTHEDIIESKSSSSATKKTISGKELIVELTKGSLYIEDINNKLGELNHKEGEELEVDLDDTSFLFEDYLTYISCVYTYKRFITFSKKAKTASAKLTKNSKLKKKLNIDTRETLEYLQELLTAFSNIKHISYLLESCMPLYSDILEDYCHKYDLDIDMFAIDTTNNEDNENDNKIARKWVKRLENSYPISFYLSIDDSYFDDEEESAEFLLEYRQKLYKEMALPNLEVWCKSIINQIYQYTFACRANYIINQTNKNIKIENKKNKTRIPLISQSTLGKKAGLNKSTINDYFTGKTMPSIEFILLISKETKIPNEYFINPFVYISEIDYSIEYNKGLHNDLEILNGEMGYVLKFLYNCWANINDATTYQSELVCKTLSYLIRDLFVDETGKAPLPTLDKSYNCMKEFKSEGDNSLNEDDIYFREIIRLYHNDELRFNKDSILFLIGRYIFDSTISTMEDDYEDETKGIVFLPETLFIKTQRIFKDKALSPQLKLHSINALLNNTDWLKEIDSDYKEQLSDYFLTKVIASIQATLKQHHDGIKYPKGYFQHGIIKTSELQKKKELFAEVNKYLLFEDHMQKKEKAFRKEKIMKEWLSNINSENPEESIEDIFISLKDVNKNNINIPKYEIHTTDEYIENKKYYGQTEIEDIKNYMNVDGHLIPKDLILAMYDSWKNKGVTVVDTSKTNWTDNYVYPTTEKNMRFYPNQTSAIAEYIHNNYEAIKNNQPLPEPDENLGISLTTIEEFLQSHSIMSDEKFATYKREVEELKTTSKDLPKYNPTDNPIDNHSKETNNKKVFVINGKEYVVEFDPDMAPESIEELNSDLVADIISVDNVKPKKDRKKPNNEGL